MPAPTESHQSDFSHSLLDLCNAFMIECHAAPHIAG